MARYIDADAVHKFVEQKVAEGKDGWSNGVPYEWAYALAVIDMQTTADVVPKSEGKWKPYKDYFTHRQLGWICTNCSALTHDLINGDTDYCPHCGAVMDTESEEEDE